MKAIAGAAMIAGAVGLSALDLAVGGAITPLLAYALPVLLSGAVAMEAGAIASALSSNRGMGITIRQPAANRNFIYGTQRVGGVSIFQSTTGSGPAQRNYVIVLADHECNGILNLFIDGRQVFWTGSGPGWSVRNGNGFGGNADHSDHKDEGGNTYNFGGLVYCEARYGDQLPGDVMASLTANDGRWVASGGSSPYVGGCTYVYLKIEADQAMFPSDPELRFTVQGKNDILDPRTNTTGYTENWALCVADVLQNIEYGVGEPSSHINTAQLIAAANVCDQQVTSVVAGTTESRYTCNAQWDTASGPGDILESMMPAAQGRLSWIGGQWYIFPAYWQGPSFTFGEGDILKDFQWQSARPIAQRYNRVRGTFIAPRFPFAVAGNLYDNNGFFDGTRANLFGLEWQSESYPQYAQDVAHGYVSDQWLAADQGIERVLNLDQKCVISLPTSQRLAKIALLRNRIGAGRTTLTMSLAAYRAIPCDVIQLNYAPFGWVNKLLEVTSVRLLCQPLNDGEPPTLMVQLDVVETSPDIYDWNPVTEELDITDTPAINPNPPSLYRVSPPTGVTVTDATATLGIGVHQPALGVNWISSGDAYAVAYQIQYRKVGTTPWLSAPSVDDSVSFAFITQLASGTTYTVQVRTLRANGAFSAWATGTGATS